MSIRDGNFKKCATRGPSVNLYSWNSQPKPAQNPRASWNGAHDPPKPSMRALRAVVCCRPEGEIFLGRFLSPPSPTHEILSSPKPTHNPMGLGGLGQKFPSLMSIQDNFDPSFQLSKYT